jgi:hypothetical protein
MNHPQNADQRRDALLLKLLQTPPQPRPKKKTDRGSRRKRHGHAGQQKSVAKNE